MSCPSGVKQSTSWPPALNNTKYTLVSFIKCYKSDRGERKYLSDSEFSPEDNWKPQKALSRKCPESIDTLNGYSDSYVENSLEEPKTDAGT